MTTNLQDFPASDDEAKLAEEERRRQEALASLQRRFAERDELRGDVPTVAGVFPQDLAPEPVKPGLPDPYAPASPAPPVNPSSAPGDAGPPALSVSPQPPEPTAEASVNPETPTATAGAEAAAALQRAQGAGGAPGAPQIGAQAPRGPNAPPLAALGATGLDAGELTAGLGADPRGSAALIEQIREQRLEDERNAARDEDRRRRRIRGILMGIAALGGMATIGSGGSVGGALPGMLAAALVRRPDEEERLLADREREGEEAAARAEREGEEADRAWRRERAAVEDAQWGAEFGETQRTNANVDANRRQRQAIAMSAEDRAAADVARDENHPVYGDTVRGARQMFRVFTRSLPEDVQAMLAAPDVQQRIDHASPAELRELMKEYGDIESSRQRGGGGGRGGVAGMQRAARADGRHNVEGIDVVPQNFRLMMRGRFENPEHADYYSQLTWSNMSQRDRDAYLRNPEMDKWREIRIPGFEQIAPGSQISNEQLNAVMADAATLSTLSTLSQRAEEANAIVENMSPSERARVMLMSAAEMQNHPAALQFEDVRQQMIGTLNQLQGGGVLNDSERINWDAQLPRITSVRNLFSGSAMASLRVAFARARADLINRIRQRGFELSDTGEPEAAGPVGDMTAAPAARQPQRRRRAPLRAGYTRLIFRNAQGRRAHRDVPNDQVEATLARMPDGVTLVSRRQGVAQ